MAGARAMGMRHVWLRPEGAASSGGPCCPDDPVITRLAQLEELGL
jgi:FMN phosphatase YigB (HAD superfamily)